jgi:hypothetical protein
MTDSAKATDGARVIRPGDSDHPAEQVRNAGVGSNGPVYSMRLTLHPTDQTAPTPTIREIEAAVEAAILTTFPGFTVGADATRTDR